MLATTHFFTATSVPFVSLFLLGAAASIKVIVVGNGAVGKSSMTTRYCKGTFTETYKKTIGVDFMEKVIDLEDLGESVHLFVWDTAGQEEYDALTSRYYKGRQARCRSRFHWLRFIASRLQVLEPHC